MATLTRDEARIAAVHLAYLAEGLKRWLEGCTPYEEQRRLDFVVSLLTPDKPPAWHVMAFEEWYGMFFRGMPEMPAHVRDSYQQAYHAGFEAGKAAP